MYTTLDAKIVPFKLTSQAILDSDKSIFLAARLLSFLDRQFVRRSTAHTLDVGCKTWIPLKSAHAALYNLQRKAHHDIRSCQFSSTEERPIVRRRTDLRLQKVQVQVQVVFEIGLRAAASCKVDS